VDEIYGLDKEIHVNHEDISQNSGSDAIRAYCFVFACELVSSLEPEGLQQGTRDVELRN
jgi:hypothetical protein